MRRCQERNFRIKELEIEALIELLVEKGIITKDELMGKKGVGVYLNRNSIVLG
jgi:hypothetical protein